MKRIITVFFYCVYLLSVLILIDYFFYRTYIKRINIISKNIPLPAIKNVDALTMSRLGYISTDKKSCFVNFNEKKAKDVIRIGCFGDSFTHGDEVSREYDYPSMLQDIFLKAGYNSVEVINFGTQWHGFSQAFIMWKYIGRKYDLDYVLLGPATLQFQYRETTFNHTVNHAVNFQGMNIDYMHARFILKNKKLELIDVYGDTYKNRAQNYFRFIPLIRYLIYDTNMPPFLACLLPRGKQLRKNPFYYCKASSSDEVKEIHKLLLLDMINSKDKIILGYDLQNVFDVVSSLNKENFTPLRVYQPRKFPYRMFRFHNSPFGNHFVAQQMFNFLTGKKTSPLYVMETADIAREIIKEASLEKCNLSEYKDMKIEINNVEIGQFLNTLQTYFGQDEQIDLKENKVVSFLAIKGKGDSILDAVFVPLNFNLTDNSLLKVCIRLQNNEKKVYTIGKVELLNPALEIGAIDLEGMCVGNSNVISYAGIKDLLKQGSFLWEKAEISILLNDETILKAVSVNHKSGDIQFQTINNKLIIIMPKGDSFVDISTLDETGVIYLSLYTYSGRKFKVPFAKWIKKQYDPSSEITYAYN